MPSTIAKPGLPPPSPPAYHCLPVSWPHNIMIDTKPFQNTDRHPISTLHQRNSTHSTSTKYSVRTQKKQTSPQQSQKEIRKKKKDYKRTLIIPQPLGNKSGLLYPEAVEYRCTKAIQLAEQAQSIGQKGKERKGKNKERLFYQRRCDVGSAFLYPFYKWTGMVSYACLRVP